MKNNPFAQVFHDAFYKDVLNGAVFTPTCQTEHPKRVKTFMNQLNHFIATAGEAPILYPKYIFDEHKLFEYALFLRGYMRDSQSVLAHLKQEYAVDKDLIALFNASSEYVAACNGKVGDKRIFDNTVGYKIWKTDLSSGLANASYLPAAEPIDAERHNLFLFMPFRIKDTQEMVNKWIFDTMRHSLDDAIFGRDVDVYVVHYPIQKSRSSNVTSVLKTLQMNESFYETEDMAFVKHNWLHFIAADIKLNNQNKVISATPYTAEKLANNFRNITIFSYCAGTANAHRCLNVLHDLTRQVYDESVTNLAMQNVFVCSYGFLPVRNNLRYSGVHFYTNAIDDDNRREPFVNLNNHALYEKTKNTNAQLPAKLSVMPDGKNYILALKLADRIGFYQNQTLEQITDSEYGHNMANISTPNIYDADNYAYNVFLTVLRNSSLGKRGINALRFSEDSHAQNMLSHSVVLSQLQQLHGNCEKF